MNISEIEPTELERYLYDLEGYLVIENVLSRDQIDELNGIIDELKLGEPPPNGRFGSAAGSAPSGPGFLDYGQLFCDLMDHPHVMGIMRMQLGDCFRLDRIFGMHMRKGMPNGRLHSDYGASQPFSKAAHGRFFAQPGYEALHGFGVAAWNLTDTGPDHGGLRIIKGSHNSHYRLPTTIRKDEFEAVTTIVEAPAGSVTFFSEALTHGTAAWRADHERRSILYKYCGSQLVWSKTRVTAPTRYELTERQTLLLEEPGGQHWFFPSLFEQPQQEAAS